MLKFTNGIDVKNGIERPTVHIKYENTDSHSDSIMQVFRTLPTTVYVMGQLCSLRHDILVTLQLRLESSLWHWTITDTWVQFITM